MDAVTRVLTAINHEEPDRVPACESDFSAASIIKHYLGPNASSYGAVGYLRNLYKIPFISAIMRMMMSRTSTGASPFKSMLNLYREVKLDLFPAFFEMQPWKFIKGGFIDNFGKINKVEDYPGDDSQIVGYHGGIFKTIEDYENFPGHPDPNSSGFLKSFLALRRYQEEKIENKVFAIPAICGLMESTWEGFGIEIFSKIIAKPKVAQKLFDRRGKSAVQLASIYAENDAKAVWVYDDYGYKGGLFMSPRNYRKYVIPWIKKICQATHKHGCKLILHSCGDIEPIFGDLIEAGVDAFNPIEATTANPEYDIFKLNERFGDKTTFIGNIAPQMLSTGTQEEIKDYSMKLIRELAPGGGFIFSSGHSINPAIPLENFQLLLKIREKYGFYPINVPQ
ncbi:MAG: hypothetical protein GY870_00180 [archaeon]|nr:hypothetical protein [archaeon]